MFVQVHLTSRCDMCYCVLLLLVCLCFGIMHSQEVVNQIVVTATISEIELRQIPLGLDIVGATLPTILYSAVVRGKVALPCDISTPAADDSVVLILWYKGEDPAPIYTLDARRGTVEQARQSAGPQLEGRAFFNMVNRPAFLQVDPVREDDAGEYRCRVDFRKARTVNTIITLKVIVPPGEPVILDEEGMQVNGLVGPYNEGDSLRLTCEATGGKPKASVTWWREYTLLDDGFIVMPGANLVRNDLYIEELKRHDLLSVLTCQASNNNITVPASTSVTLDLNLKPAEVRIDPSRTALSAEQEYEFTCAATGSRPPATVTWWKGNRQMKKEVRRTSQTGDVTTSLIAFVAGIHDHGIHFACRAHNPMIPGSAITDGWTLEIHYPPRVSLSLASTFKKGDIREGNDVYFECSIRANPYVSEIGWYFEGQELRTNTSAGIVISNQSLVLQKVKRRNRGHYRCVATNTEGTGASNEVFLRIRYAPDCRPHQKVVYGVGRFEPVRITCDLDADPENVTFRWRFNSSFGKSVDLSGFLQNNNGGGTRSALSYVVHSDEDYGSIACWGSNDVGRQRTPCLFTLIPAGPPEPPQNCTVSNQTESSLRIDCVEGYNGGLVQRFHVEVYEEEGRRIYPAPADQLLIAQSLPDLPINSSNPRPQFPVTALPSGQRLRFLVYAENAKGRSAPVVFWASTLQKPEKLTGLQGMVIIRPVLGLLIGIIIALVIIAVAVIIYMKLTRQKKEKVTKAITTPEILDKCQTPLKKDTDDAGTESEEKGPDIIPANVNTKSQQQSQGQQQHQQLQQQQHYMAHDHEKEPSPSSPKTQSPTAHYGSLQRNPIIVENRLAQSQRPGCRRQEDVTYAELALEHQPITQVATLRRRTDLKTDYPTKVDLQRHIYAHKGGGGGDSEDEELSDTSINQSKRESAV